MSSREAILAAVRRAQPAAVPLPAVPPFDDGAVDLRERFAESLARMGGSLTTAGPEADLTALVAELHPSARIVCSATPEVAGNRDLAAVAAPMELDDVDVAVVRAACGIAETGSVLLTEAELGVDALGYLAQHLVVLLDPAAIVGNLHHAFGRPELARARYTVLTTGPSATADIEGVLIHGAQGVRSLTVVLAPVGPAQPTVTRNT
jgi:L-lactate dehydrogenase complex protein LldG